jgi:hypothetical protein
MIPSSANDRKRLESAGKITGSGRKVHEVDGNGSSIPGLKIFGFFRPLLAKLLLFPVRNDRKAPENAKIFRLGILLP